MPATITGVAGAYVNTASIPVDSDVASAASVQTPFQRLLDNEKSLYDTVTTIGVSAIRKASDITALKALTGMLNGQHAYVWGYGTYQYIDPLATAEALPHLVAPTSGTGRWINSLYSITNVANGVAKLDASSKVPAAQLRGISQVSTSSIGITSDSVMAGVTVTAMTLAVAVLVGDVVMVDAIGAAKAASVPGAGDEPTVAVQTTGATVTSAGYVGMTIVRTGSEPVASSVTFTATSAGTLNINLNIVPQGAAVGATVFRGTSMRATVMRA